MPCSGYDFQVKKFISTRIKDSHMHLLLFCFNGIDIIIVVKFFHLKYLGSLEITPIAPQIYLLFIMRNLISQK
jgi:hypothetical protein